MSFIFRSYKIKYIKDFFLNKRVNIMFTTASKDLDVLSETSAVF